MLSLLNESHSNILIEYTFIFHIKMIILSKLAIHMIKDVLPLVAFFVTKGTMISDEEFDDEEFMEEKPKKKRGPKKKKGADYDDVEEEEEVDDSFQVKF